MTGQELRIDLAQWMIDNYEHLCESYAEFATPAGERAGDHPTASFHDHIASLMLDNAWGSVFELRCLATKWNLHIAILDKACNWLYLFSGFPSLPSSDTDTVPRQCTLFYEEPAPGYVVDHILVTTTGPVLNAEELLHTELFQSVERSSMSHDAEADLFDITNRHPFDLPEAEAELVSGYNVEYSSMAFALFSLGGWQGPARAALPRYRYDQLMTLGWQVFLPVSMSFVILSLVLALGVLAVQRELALAPLRRDGQ
eukprot:gene44139-54854_t